MFLIRPIPLVIVLLMAGVARSADADKPDAKGVAFFESKIRPALVEHCYKCHSGQTGKSEGNLLLDSRKATRAPDC